MDSSLVNPAMSKICDMSNALKTEIGNFMLKPLEAVSKAPTLSYVNAFGELYQYEKIDKNSSVFFEWPTLKDLEDLKLSQPLQLKTVRTKDNSSYLCGIQFEFTNGIKSPFVDGGAGGNER